VRPLLLVLTVMQDAEIRSLARVVFEGAGHRVVEAGRQEQAESLLSNGLIPDILLWEGNSAASRNALPHLASLVSAERICVLTSVADQSLREQAVGAGIKHLLTKPLTRDGLESLVDAMGEHPACESREPSTELPCVEAIRNTDHPTDMPALPYVEELGGNNFFLAASPQMLEIHRQVKLLADIDVNVLILGESGTGKEVVAQLIHKNSRRSREKFLKVNCAALPNDLLESEFFGHRQGAFTGAINDRAGKFEQANRGTLLLDEIGEIGVQMQAKLLHVLQDGQFARLGAQETTKVDVRVLAATNIQIEDAMLERTFREDLYYRLSVFTIKVPPLRERREEIPYLIEQIIRRTPPEITNGFRMNLPSRLIDMALASDWRGNVRELRNFVTRAVIMRDTDAAVRELEEKVAAAASSHPVSERIDGLQPCAGIRSVVRDVKARTEIEMIQSALDAFGWNRRRAAQYLNVSYRALLYKIQQHRLRPSPVAVPMRPNQSNGPLRKSAVERP
jgi:two-component system, NtrC family, response regulator AtoC